MANDVLAAGLAPPAVIDAPPLPLSPLSLPQIARPLIDEEAGVDPTDGRWQAGITFRPEPLAHAGGYAPCSGSDIVMSDDCDGSAVPPVWLPFWVTYASLAPLTSAPNILDLQGRAIRGLRAHEAWKVELEWWTGALEPGNAYLANPTGLTGAGGFDVATPGAAVGVRRGLAALDEAIAQADIGLGVIHVTPYLLEALASQGGIPVVREGGRILTVNGNWIVPGNGYPGTGPGNVGGGPFATSQWAYATDMVYFARGLVESLPRRYPVGPDGSVADSDFAQALIDAGSEVPTAAAYIAQRPWSILTQGALRAAILIDTTTA